MCPGRPISTFACLLSFLLISARSGQAQWTPNGVPVCTAENAQSFPMNVPDGQGGTMITWSDARGGNDDIYVQHVLASGAMDPSWPPDGLALCAAAGDQRFPALVADGIGGAIVCWMDHRAGSHFDIYAQHVLAGGMADPAWPADGSPLCVAANEQQFPVITSDGAGGAIVAWGDFRSSIANADIYAQRVLASGAADPAWPVNGLPVCVGTYDDPHPAITSDGAGGAIVTWPDGRHSFDIYAQHVLPSGAVDPAWPTNGRALCAAPDNQLYPRVVSDGLGGAIVCWMDYRGGAGYVTYAQRILASGATDPAWPADGRALSTAAGDQLYPQMVPDDAGGAIVCWKDHRSGQYDIYAQRVLAAGAVDPAWPANGRAVCTAVNDQHDPTLVEDGAGGAIVAWMDVRSGAGSDIYAQRVLPSGSVDAAWPVDGRALCTGTGAQYPAIASDGAGGGIVTWVDFRSGLSANPDIYAQHILSSGDIPAIPVVPMALTLPGMLNLRSLGRWVTAYLEPPAGFDASAIDVGSVQFHGDLAGSDPVPVDFEAPAALGDHDQDQLPDLMVKFGRAAVELTLSEGAAVPATVTGVVAGRPFSGTATLKVLRARITAPTAGSSLNAGSRTMVRWEIPAGIPIQSVALLSSLDDGANWTLETSGLANHGSCDWMVPNVASQRARVAVVLVESADSSGYAVAGVLGVSDAFAIVSPVGVGGVSPPGFALHGVAPNPGRGVLYVAFSLADTRPARLEVLDVTARRVMAFDVGTLGPGRHQLPVRSGLRAGIYLVRLKQGDRSQVARVVVLH